MRGQLLLIAASLASGMTMAAETVEAILARMDRTAPAFKGMTAHVRRVQHTAVINEDTADSGTMSLKRSHSDIHMLVDLTEPDPKAIYLHGDRLEIYYPKMQTIEEYDVGKNRALVDQFLLIGFGTSGADLSAAYQIKLVGSETIGDVKATHLEMIPKSKEVLKYLTKLELWIPETAMYPVQQKLNQPAGDYMLITYTSVKLNPSLSDADVKLKAPKNVKRVAPQK